MAPSSFDISWCFYVPFLIKRSSLGLGSVENRSAFEQLKGPLFNFYFLGDLRQRFSSAADSVVLSCQAKMDSLWRSDMELHYGRAAGLWGDVISEGSSLSGSWSSEWVRKGAHIPEPRIWWFLVRGWECGVTALGMTPEWCNGVPAPGTFWPCWRLGNGSPQGKDHPALYPCSALRLLLPFRKETGFERMD